MKSNSKVNSNIVARFNKEKLDSRELNYLTGGDANGGQPGIGPWDPPG